MAAAVYWAGRPGWRYCPSTRDRWVPSLVGIRTPVAAIIEGATIVHEVLYFRNSVGFLSLEENVNRAVNWRHEILTLAQRDFQLLVWTLDDLLIWFGPAFNLAGFGAEEAEDFGSRLVFTLPGWSSTAAAQPVDLIVGDDPDMDANGSAGGAATSWQVHLTRREWELLKSSLGKFLEIDGISQDWQPETLEAMEHLHERLSEAAG